MVHHAFEYGNLSNRSVALAVNNPDTASHVPALRQEKSSDTVSRFVDAHAVQIETGRNAELAASQLSK